MSSKAFMSQDNMEKNTLLITNLNTQGHLDSVVSQCPSYYIFVFIVAHNLQEREHRLLCCKNTYRHRVVRSVT